ncbi:MAG TPA: hypothetical protein VIY51_19225 [Xanthobacteraceae bacterium]
MLNRWKIVLSAALIFVGSLAATAKSGRIPTIDLQKGCRAAAAELTALFGNQTNDPYDTCMSDEQAGRGQLVKEWDTFPALAKSKCVQPGAYLPSYVEWLTCIELTREVIKMRKATSEAAGKSRVSTPRQCPVVKIGEDGNIVYVIAC